MHVQLGVSRTTKIRTSAAAVAILLLAILAFPALGRTKIKKAKASENPAQFAAFSHPLPNDIRVRHALDRLTFGPRPDDLRRVEKMGLNKWLDAQLHPERLEENPLLEERLEPLETLRLDIHDIYVHYPPPQMIAAVARGNAPLPDDPELRAMVVRLADRYLERSNKASDNKDPNDDSDLALKVKITDILTSEQIETLQSGKPEEKQRVLESIPENKLADFSWSLYRKERQALLSLAPVDLRRQLMRAVNPQSVVTSDLCEGKLLRAIYSTRQLQELLTDFWFNHFNVNIDKGADHYYISSYERDAIRARVFGKFFDMLLETAKSPAMLYYLDNWESVGPEENYRRMPNPKARKRGLNENYGRELLELHTLGVDGGYNQKDVTEVARCFTGWTIAAPRKGGGFEYNDKWHDHGQKLVLGHVIPAGGGMNDGLRVLDILAHHPSTAHFISLKLAQRFVADNPPPALVNRMAETFLKSDGDLRKVVTTMISSGEFWSEGSYRAKVKTPFEMVVSAVRATNADVISAFLLTNQVQRLGEPLYRKVEPTGYSSANAEWVSSAALLDRMNFAIALAHDRVPGVKVDVAAWQQVSDRDPLALARILLDQDPSEQTKEAINKMLATADLQKQLAQNAKAGPPKLASLVAGLSLGSPEFQRR